MFMKRFMFPGEGGKLMIQNKKGVHHPLWINIGSLEQPDICISEMLRCFTVEMFVFVVIKAAKYLLLLLLFVIQ